MTSNNTDDITDTQAQRYFIATTQVRKSKMMVEAISVVPRKAKLILRLSTLNHSGCHFVAKYRNEVVKLKIERELKLKNINTITE